MKIILLVLLAVSVNFGCGTSRQLNEKISNLKESSPEINLITAGKALEDIKGNGGDILVCEEGTNGGRAFELLDFYEARKFLESDIDLNSKLENYQDKIRYALDKLKKFDDRADLYQERALKFEQNAFFLADANLEDINDSAHYAKPKGCKVVQLSILKDPALPPVGKKYIVDKDLWEKIGEDNKAGLILHEIIYEEALNLGQKNSIWTRYFNGHLVSEKINKKSLTDYLTILQQIGFPNYSVTINNLRFRPDSVTFYKQGNTIESGVLYEDTVDRVRMKNIVEPLNFKQDSKVSFYRNGTIKSGSLKKEGMFQCLNNKVWLPDAETGYILFDDDGYLKEEILKTDKYLAHWFHLGNTDSDILIKPLAVQDGEKIYLTFDFYKNCIPNSGWLANLEIYYEQTNTVLIYEYQNLPVYKKKVNFLSNKIVEFHESGFVKSGILFETTSLDGIDGNSYEISGNNYVEFNKLGKLIVGK